MGIEDEADRTLFIRNLDMRVTEELLFELFLQAGPLIKTKIPKDVGGKQKTFGFAVYKHEESVPYAMELLDGTPLFGRMIHVQFRAGSTYSNNSGNFNPTSTPNPRRLRVPPQFTSPPYTPPAAEYTAPQAASDIIGSSNTTGTITSRMPGGAATFITTGNTRSFYRGYHDSRWRRY